jgi:phage baseplate assembly protein W
MANNNLVETAISLPFTISDFGNVAAATTQDKIWADKVRSVIGTRIEERIMNPDYGTKIPQALFESEASMLSTINHEVEHAFGKFLDQLTLMDLTLNNVEGSGLVEATILYRLPNEKIGEVSIGVAYINGNLPLYEEKR